MSVVREICLHGVVGTITRTENQCRPQCGTHEVGNGAGNVVCGTFEGLPDVGNLQLVLSRDHEDIREVGSQVVANHGGFVAPRVDEIEVVDSIDDAGGGGVNTGIESGDGDVQEFVFHRIKIVSFMETSVNIGLLILNHSCETVGGTSFDSNTKFASISNRVIP